jgi:integrase/recombinase XerD
MVPLGERCGRWLDRYLDEARPVLVAHAETDDPDNQGAAHPPATAPLFCASHGGRFHVDVSELARKYMNAAGVNKPAALHIFRHTAATLMMENGADLRSVQEMLGHERISSTEVYTHVSIRRLREVHEKTHPAEILLSERRDRQKDRQAEATPAKKRKRQKRRHP